MIHFYNWKTITIFPFVLYVVSYVSGADFRKQVRSHSHSFLLHYFYAALTDECVAVNVLVNDVLKTKMRVCCVMPGRNIQLKLPVLD